MASNNILHFIFFEMKLKKIWWSALFFLVIIIFILFQFSLNIFHSLNILLQLIIYIIIIVFSIIIILFPIAKYFQNQKDKFWIIAAIISLLFVLVLGLYQILK